MNSVTIPLLVLLKGRLCEHRTQPRVAALVKSRRFVESATLTSRGAFSSIDV
jgi:hypothetical protein